MCVICVSPAGTRQPSTKEMLKMFDWNPDGAGYMIARNGKVELHKGFMDVDSFLWALKSERLTAKDPVVYHFRISTQAGINPEMTHPFPLSNRKPMMKALDLTCPCGVAHNGIIRLTSDPNNHEYSDTALFITDYLSHYIHGPESLKDEKLLNMIGLLIQSKMAIMDGSGYIATIGSFVNENGLLFSNMHHRAIIG